MIKIPYIKINRAGILDSESSNMTVLHKINCMKFLNAIDLDDSIEDRHAFDNI